MDQPDHEAEPFFSLPVRQITEMLIVLGLVGFGGYIAYPRIGPVFLTNVWLNGFILFVFVIGVLACFAQVFQLATSVNWIVGFTSRRPGHEMTKAPRLLAPLAALLRSRGARMQIGSASATSILDSVATRIDEARDITRYIVNLLIFLGLLGTFFGLATTVPALVETIKSLSPQNGEAGVDVFARLMGGLEAQLGGMGTAFASSLIGLAGSLVVGLLELFAGHGQNRFYRELEEWLSTITRVGFSSGDGDAGVVQTAMMTVLDHMSEQIETMQAIHAETDASRVSVEQHLASLAASVESMAGSVSAENGSAGALQRVADGQERLIEILHQQGQDGAAHVDAESRMRLRSIDVQLLRILEEMASGRQETVTNLRSDLGALTQAIRDATHSPAGKG